MRRLAARNVVLGDELLLALDALLVHILKQVPRQLDILDKRVAAALGKVLADHNPQHLETVGLGGHGVSRDDPPPHAQLVGERKLVVVAVLVFGEAERDEGEALAGLLAHDDEVEGLERVAEVVGGAGEVGHDGAVALLAEADELVVLADDLAGALGEVEGEGGLVGAQVVDVEDELLGEILGCAPDDPADTGVDEAIL